MAKSREKTCRGPECDRPIVAFGLCIGHYKQQRAGNPLLPIGHRNQNPKQHISVRVAAATREAVLADYKGAVAALDAWAAKRSKPRRGKTDGA